jgi:hypothetical protein
MELAGDQYLQLVGCAGRDAPQGNNVVQPMPRPFVVNS